MTAVFERILEMSLTAAVVIVVVMFIRLLLRKAPRKYAYALWSVAAFRLVCPVSFRAFFSLFSFTKGLDEVSVETILPDPVVSSAPVVSPGYFDSVASPPVHTGNLDPDHVVTYPVTTPPTVEPPAVTTINWMEVAAIVWLVGLTALLIYGIVSYARLRRRMDTSVRMEGNVWQSDRVQSPFILGFVRPKIYLPFGLSADQQRYVLAHERYHLKRFDHVVRPLSFLILAVHWFNPLVWVAYYMMGRDMEMSCDEKVLSGGESVKDYSTTLLSFAANRRFPSPSPLAFGESGVKGRIKNALNWKKPRTWVTIIAIIVCIVVIVVCAANPSDPQSEPEAPYDWTSTVTMEELGLVDCYVVGEMEETLATLSEVQRQDLAELLNCLDFDDFTYHGIRDGYVDGAVELTIAGGEYALSHLPDGTLILGKLFRDGYGAGRTEEWNVDSGELKQFIQDLPKVEKTIVPDESDRLCYRFVEDLYMSPLSSAVSFEDNVYYYLVWGDELQISSKEDGYLGSYFAMGNWQKLTDELIHRMEWGTRVLGATNLWNVLREERPMIRMYGEDSMFLLYFGDEMWVGSFSVDENGYISIWKLHRLEESDEFVGKLVIVGALATWQADLTHDGVDETIALTEVTAGEQYVLTVTDQTGKTLWEEEAGAFHVDWNGIYLYEQNGKEYLMTWVPYGSTGICNFRYKVFSLTDEGEQVVLVSDFFEFSTMGEEHILQVDVAALRGFENEVNALLSNAFVLIDTDNAKPVYSTEANRVTRLWSGQSDYVERMQQKILNSMEQLAVWQADLTHDGVDETITLSYADTAMEYKLYVTNAAGKVLWIGEASTFHMGYLGYYLYERDGKEYLLEWSTNGWTGTACYYYQVFSLTEEGKEKTLRLNDFSYDTNGIEQILFIDISDMRAYEKEANALLADAVVLIDTNDGQFVQGDPANPVTGLWESPADQWEKTQQELIDQLPIVMAYMELDQELLNCIEEQVKLRLEDHELAHVQQVEDISTGTVGTTSGHYIYRVVYQPGDYEADTHRVTWSDQQYFYLITHEEWGESTGPEDDEWHFVGTLSEAELQSRFNTPEMLDQYSNDPYLAAVVEMVRAWRE